MNPTSFIRVCTLWIAVLPVLLLVLSDDITHTYTEGEAVKIYANKIGPFNNPLETYAYYERPGCRPASEEHKFPSIGQALVGDEHFEMNLKIAFRKSHDSAAAAGGPQVHCEYTPTAADVLEWNAMVRRQYWYQLLVDDLPMWAVFGNESRVTTTPSPTPNNEDAAATTTHVPNLIEALHARRIVNQIFTLQNFSLGYNGDRLVSANLSVHDPVTPEAGKPIIFRYVVTFVESNVEFERRFDRYLDDDFFEHRIHWFSVFNSFMIVLFLLGMVGMLLSRTLRADIAKLSADAAVESARREGGSSLKEEWADEGGWKQLHADVFRVPPYPWLLCGLLGAGSQLVILATLLIAVAMISVVHTAPSGSLLSYAVFAFATTSFIAGFVSSTMFQRFTLVGSNMAHQWMRCMFCAATLFPGVVLLGGFLLNFIAIAYDSAQAIPFGGMLAMVALWACVSCPLVVIGTVVGRHGRFHRGGSSKNHHQLPRINQIPRIIPSVPWYRQGTFLLMIGGVLPFGTIFIELYMVFTSFWSYKWYYVYGFLLLVFGMLIMVTACVSILATYFLLSAEDHRWPWQSFALGGSTAAYVFAYAVYFYLFKTKMSGFLMWSFYFSYMGLMCYGMTIVCGSIAYAASAFFVRRIYRNVKTD